MIYRCNEHPRCNYVSARRSNMERHRKTMHAMNRKYECCGKQFCTKFAFQEHTKAKHEAAGYSCSWEGCDVVCTRLALLARHFRVHTGEKPHHCPAPECDYRSNNRSNLERHANSVHGISLPPPQRRRRTVKRELPSTWEGEHTDDTEYSLEDCSSRSEESCERYCSTLLEFDETAAADFLLDGESTDTAVSDGDDGSERFQLPTPPLSGELQEDRSHQRECVLDCPDCAITFPSQLELTCHRESLHDFEGFDAARVLLHFWQRRRDSSTYYLFSV